MGEAINVYCARYDEGEICLAFFKNSHATIPPPVHLPVVDVWGHNQEEDRREEGEGGVQDSLVHHLPQFFYISKDDIIIRLCHWYECNLSASTLIKKKNKFSSYIRKFRMEQLRSHIWLTASSYLRISSNIRQPFLIYDFATAPLWISLYMRKSWFSFLSVYIQSKEATKKRERDGKLSMFASRLSFLLRNDDIYPHLRFAITLTVEPGSTMAVLMNQGSPRQSRMSNTLLPMALLTAMSPEKNGDILYNFQDCSKNFEVIFRRKCAGI